MTLHENPVETAGSELEDARAAVVLLHGRGASAASILSLAGAFSLNDVAYLAPQASGNVWYPHSFLAPLSMNEPGITAAIQAVQRTCQLALDAGIPWSRIVIAGFSQGACLSLESVARNPRRYGGVLAFSGGLIGSGEIPGVDPPADKRFDYAGSLDGTPVFLGCSDVDAHIPVQRVQDSTVAMRSLGADVTERIYRGMGHTINEEELQIGRDLIGSVAASA